MISLVESLFDQNWLALSHSLLGWPERAREPMEFLSAEKRQQVRDLGQWYGQSAEIFSDKKTLGLLSAADEAQLQELDRQRQAKLGAILSPLELEENLYRRSQTAEYVRRNLPEAGSESEFRTMVTVAQEFGMSNVPMPMRQRYLLESPDSAPVEAEDERDAAFYRRLKEVLGEARFAELQAQEQQRETEQARRSEK